jgi:HemY protein
VKYLLWLIILAALAVGVTFITDLNTGYALFIVPPYRVELSLNLFIIYVVLTVTVLYLLLKLIAGTLALPGKVRRWRERRKQAEARKQGYLAVIALMEGRMQQVERAVKKALAYEKNGEARTVVTLTGAKAAHVRRDFAQRDQYLQQAGADRLNIAAAMLKAEMLADERNDHEALQVLEQIHKAAPKLISAMRLELRIQQREGNALRVIELANKLEKREVLAPELADRIRHDAYLQHTTKIINIEELESWWSQLPYVAKYHPDIALLTATYFVKFEDKLAAARVIEETLEAAWDKTLLDYYGKLGLTGINLTTQLQKSEAWLKLHPQDAQLLLTLGRLCAASELWGKAQSYFEASLAIDPAAATHAELARLLDNLEHYEQANQHYRRGVELAVKL